MAVPAGALGGPCRVEAEPWAPVNGGLTYTDRVQGACAQTLLGYYSAKHGGSASPQHWRAAILAGQVTVNGEVQREPDAPLPPAATLAHHRPGWAEPPAPNFLDVLWWDEHVVAVNKPSGLQVLPAGPFHERCALTLLRRFHAEHAAQLAGMPAPVHRLGRGTSGVLICACSEQARRQLSADFVEHGGPNSGCLRKVYRALVRGLVAADEGEVDVPIGRVAYPGVRGGLFAARPDGGAGAKPSRSRYWVLARDAAACTSLVDVEIFTGRPHQIRIHMAAAGHPLVGDPLYAPGGLPLPLQQAAGGGEEEGGGGEEEAAGGGGGGGAPAGRGAAGAGARCKAGGGGDGGGDGGAARRVVMPGDCGYHLHSAVLEFRHPVTGERIVAAAEPPPPLRPPSPAGSAGG